MRLLKLGIYHSTYLREFYETRAGLGELDYAAQHRILIDDCFGSSDFWTRALNKLGYETADVIANAEPLQKRWARENDASFNEPDWLFDIAAAQVKKFRPDALLVADYSTFTAEFLRTIKRENPSLQIVLGWCGAPYADASVFGEWDIALSCIPEMVADFKSKGHNSFHVNHAFAPQILDKLDLNRAPSVDFAFVGSIFKQSRFHVERERILIELARRTNLRVWSDVKRPTFAERGNDFVRRAAYQTVNAASGAGVPRRLLSALPLVGKAARWQSPPAAEERVDKRIAARAAPPVFGVKMFQQLRDSLVVLNTHIDISPVSASNMRLFEATGVGSCLLTDWKENLHDLFEPDTEAVSYRTADECVEKVGFLLEHEPERRQITAAGQRRTLRDHTFDNRARQIDTIIKEYFAARKSSTAKKDWQ